jgi:hypothetical protein
MVKLAAMLGIDIIFCTNKLSLFFRQSVSIDVSTFDQNNIVTGISFIIEELQCENITVDGTTIHYVQHGELPINETDFITYLAGRCVTC